ncbi:MAG: HAD-IC family P-type ATPase, partial [Oscillospiraceae bacterium]|nr:HAD-IC family P-type ATPase [Oscillospiraceae bacterium]
IALAIKAAAGWTAEDNEAVLQGEEIPGRGVTCFFEGKQIYVGNAAMLSEHGVWFQVPSRPGAAIHVAVDNVYWGYILMSDKVREGAFDAVEELRSQGMKNVVMLTGDDRSETAKLARSLNFDMVKTELSEEEKLSAVEFLRHGLGKGECLACVGDGFHDAALFKHADIGIALSAMGDDTAEQAADLILMDDDLARIPVAVRIARGTDLLVKESAIALGAIKLLLLVLTLAGVLPAVPAVFVNAAAECLAALNALRGFTLV